MNKLILFLLFAGFLVFGLLTGCDDNKDCPVCPDPEPESISDYDFYLRNFAPYGIRVFNTRQMEFTDFYPTELIDDYAISQSADRMYITSNSVYAIDSINVITLPNMDTVGVIQEDGFLRISNTGKYLFVRNYISDKILFYDALSYSLLFYDSGFTSDGRFLADDSKFYTIHPANNEIRIYDMIGESLLTQIQIFDPEYDLHPILYDIQPVGSGNHLYIEADYSDYAFYKYIISYYVENDSIGLRYKVGEGSPQLVITPDEKTLIFTDPPPTFGNYGPASDIIFIDIERDRLSYILNTQYSFEDATCCSGFDPVDFAVSPDSRYMLVAGGNRYGMPGSFAIADLMRRKFIFSYSPELYDDSIMVTSVKCPLNQ